jgi:uncharacterized membrane protein
VEVSGWINSDLWPFIRTQIVKLWYLHRRFAFLWLHIPLMTQILVFSITDAHYAHNHYHNSQFCDLIMNFFPCPNTSKINLTLSVFQAIVQFLIQLNAHVTIAICFFVVTLLHVLAHIGYLQGYHLQRNSFIINSVQDAYTLN